MLQFKEKIIYGDHQIKRRKLYAGDQVVFDGEEIKIED